MTVILLCLGLGWVIYDSLHENLVNTGDSAPNFKVVTDNGREITRNEFGGKVLILNFWATWCGPCIQEIPSLDALQRQLGPQGVVVVAVSVDRNEAAYKKFLQQMQPAFYTARDPKGDISASYGTFKYPESYIIDSKGRVLAKEIGARDWASPEVLDRIKRLL